MQKQCLKCHVAKSEQEFAFKDKPKNRRAAQCRTCHNIYSRAHYIKYKSRYVAKAVKARKKVHTQNREYLDNYKQTVGCSVCSENNPVCLDFHHKDPKAKSFNISRAAKTMATVRIKVEVAKCVVLCSNCHRKLHAVDRQQS